MIQLQKQWIKCALYIALASVSCLLFSAFTPPLLTPAAAAGFPIIGALDAASQGYWARFSLSFLLLGDRAGHHGPRLPRERPPISASAFARPCSASRHFWLLIPVAVLLGAFGATASDLGSFYPYSRDLVLRVRESGLAPFVGHYAAYFFLYYVPWEFFFRGFLIFPFALAAEREGSGPTAIAALVLFQTIPSTLLHFGHPLSELASAVAAGLIFGALAWKTRSIVPGLLLHAALGLGTDAFIVLKGSGYL